MALYCSQKRIYLLKLWMNAASQQSWVRNLVCMVLGDPDPASDNLISIQDLWGNSQIKTLGGHHKDWPKQRF